MKYIGEKFANTKVYFGHERTSWVIYNVMHDMFCNKLIFNLGHAQLVPLSIYSLHAYSFSITRPSEVLRDILFSMNIRSTCLKFYF